MAFVSSQDNAEPEIVFRDASVGQLYTVCDTGTSTPIFGAASNSVLAADFNTDPSIATTFGAINPTTAVQRSPTLSINDVSLSERNSGTTAFNFTVTLSGAALSAFALDFASSDGTATAGASFQTVRSTLNSAGNHGETQTATVQVIGDTMVEIDQTLLVTLSNLLGNADVVIGDGVGTRTISNDDSVMAITPIHRSRVRPKAARSRPRS